MSKGYAGLFGLALLTLPGGLSAQEIGVSVTVVRPVEQPQVEVTASDNAIVSEVPAGWSWSVHGGTEPMPSTVQSPDASSATRPRHTVVGVSPMALVDRAETVTWTFAPI